MIPEKSGTLVTAMASIARRPVKPAEVSETKRDLHDPALYVNRELSMLQFQKRVLEEAQNPATPLLERVKFLSILGSNLDEFFMVRVAGLQNQVEAGLQDTGPDGMSPRQQLDAIRVGYEALIEEAHRCRRDIFDTLAVEGIRILNYTDLSEEQREIARSYFHETIFPVLTPLAFDPGRPFPHISNLSLNFSILIRDSSGDNHFARLKVPDTLPQLIALQKSAKASGPLDFVWIEQVIQVNLQALFPGMDVVESHLFRITRGAEAEIRELEAEDLLETVEETVRQRRFNDVVRLEVGNDMPEGVLRILEHNLEIDNGEVFRFDEPLGLVRLRQLASVDRPELKESAFVSRALESSFEDSDIFSTIRRGDILQHYPFDSFQPVVDFLRTAAHDPDVLAIKMTLYRVGRNSPVVKALLEAMAEGKQVAVLVELKARFDEESNIEWARALEREGVHVVYGLVGLKIHAKVAMVVRREGDYIRRYVHLSTGNYNAVTAHLYTDLGLFTCDPDIGADVTDLFNYLTGYSAKADYRKLLVAPINLRKGLEALIRREIAHAQAGRPSLLIAKVNSLIDPRIIRLLYEASQAGVQVDLLVRGVCCLRPGIAGVSDNITVTSIVGRFLEHSRIFYFLNGGDDEVYLGSADLAQRNINRRVEVIFPVHKSALLTHLRDKVLALYLADNAKARRMQPDGSYVRLSPAEGESTINSQARLLKDARKR